MIKNNTDQIFQLSLNITDEYLEGSWVSDEEKSLSYEVYEKEHYIRSEFWGKYTRHNTLYRKIFDTDGILTNDEYIVENHAIMMYEPLLPENIMQEPSLV